MTSSLLADPAGNADGSPPRGLRGHGNGHVLDLVIAAMAIGVFSAPLFFGDRTFTTDFGNSLWLGWVQSLAIAHQHLPTLFDHGTATGLFSPTYVFFGGAPFVLVGLCSAVVGGHFLTVFALFSTGVAAITYGGALWLAHQCGVRGPWAHAVPLTVVTAAYYAADLYGRGAWPEWVAFSSLPLACAAASSLLRSPRLRPGPVCALAVATVLFTGSHNVVLLFGTLLLVLAGVPALCLVAPRVPLGRYLRVAAVLALATLANGWFLLPDLAFGGTTGETSLGISNYAFDSAEALFSPLRYLVPTSSSPGLYVEAPVWFIAWALVIGGLAFALGRDAPEWRRPRRAFLLVGTALAALLGLILATPLWPRLPSTIRAIQFPYRLNGFVYLLAAGLLLPVLTVLQRLSDAGRRRHFVGIARATLVVAVLASGVLSAWQVLIHSADTQQDSLSTRVAALTSPTTPPATWYEGADVYDDAVLPVYAVPAARFVTIPAGAVAPGGNSFYSLVNLPDGPTPIALNVVATPKIAAIGGSVAAIGRTVDGDAVVIRHGALTGPGVVTVDVAHDAALVGGRIVALAGGGALLVLVVVLALGSLWRRRSLRSTPSA